MKVRHCSDILLHTLRGCSARRFRVLRGVHFVYVSTERVRGIFTPTRISGVFLGFSSP